MLCACAGERAAQTYIKISECHIKLDSKHEAASAYVDAANAFKKCNEDGAPAGATVQLCPPDVLPCLCCACNCVSSQADCPPESVYPSKHAVPSVQRTTPMAVGLQGALRSSAACAQRRLLA